MKIKSIHLLIVTGVVGFLVLGTAVFRSSPMTPTETWPSSQGGYVHFGANEKRFTHLLVSMLAVEDGDVSVVSSCWSSICRTKLVVNGEEISLAATPLVIVLDKNGTVHAGPCPVNRREFQQLIDAFNDAPLVPGTGKIDSIALVSDFIASYSDRNWPSFVRTLLPETSEEKQGPGKRAEKGDKSNKRWNEL